jgi:hypothetical protein
MPALLRCAAGLIAFLLLSSTSVTDPAIAITSSLLVRKQDAVVLPAFAARVSEYARLHREIAGTLPAIQPTADMRALQRTLDALRARIKSARRGANQGDIITAEVAAWLRARIATCPSCGKWEALVAGCGDEDDMPPSPAPPRINGALPPVACHFVPPQLLSVLPPLPRELMYRIVGQTLVLWDYDADLIVDVLSDPLATHTPVQAAPPGDRR